MDIKLGKIVDINTIADIENRSIKDPWSSDSYRNHINNNGTILIAQIDNRPTAFLSGKIILDEAEIYRVAVLEKFRQRNIATLLILEFEKIAIKLGAKTVFLEVREGNSSAIALYHKSGFNSNGKRKNYYKDGEDCIIMRKSL